MKIKLSILLALTLTLVLSGCEKQQPVEHYPQSTRFTTSETKGPTLYPKYSLLSAYDDTVISDENYTGQVQLVVFFATWCKSCVEEIGTLKKTQNKFKDRGFTVVAISTGFEDKKSIQNLARKTKINYPLLRGDNKVAKEFGGVATIPVAFLISKEGAIVKKYISHIDFDVLSADISSLL